MTTPPGASAPTTSGASASTPAGSGTGPRPDGGTPGPDGSGEGLRRSIGPRLLLLFILGDVLGAGIYALVGTVAAEVGGAVWVPLLVALGMALLTALSYAELVTRFPRAGGAAVFVQHAFGRPVLSFLVGFAMLSAGVVSAAALSLAFAGDYLAQIVDLPRVPVALAFLAVVMALNLRGIRDSLRANVVMTLVEVGGLVLVVVLAATVLGSGGGDLSQAVQLEPGWAGASAVLAASTVAFYSFVGFEVSANIAEEARDPRRDYPRALITALLVAGVLYVLVGLAVSVATPGGAGSSDAPLLDVVAASPVGIPAQAFAVIALVAVANGALLTMIMASRLTYGMARERLLPSVLGRTAFVDRGEGRGTPAVAVVVTTVVAGLLVATGSLATLAATVVMLLLVVFAAVNVAVLVLRRRPEEGEQDHFRTWWPVPVLALATCVLLAAQQPWDVWGRAGLMLAVGLALYALTRLARRGRTEEDAERAR
ncbi:APC family permease [Aquipuribacter hungaricus]|uniref:APC family permease n=1 Tax=Aquipuribacter hungaricus TaxID=545624 RepID=A0ABV7WL46_9MICO